MRFDGPQQSKNIAGVRTATYSTTDGFCACVKYKLVVNLQVPSAYPRSMLMNKVKIIVPDRYFYAASNLLTANNLGQRFCIQIKRSTYL